MKPVFQTIIDPVLGDCWRCSIASILEVEANEVPHFNAALAPGGYLDPATAFEEWLLECGFAYIEICPWRIKGGSEANVTDLLHWSRARGVYAIASVPSQKYEGGMHAVVITWEEGSVEGSVRVVVAHDPNPGNQPYDLATTKISMLAFIVPIVPVRSAAP